jgi:hypothetical protein
VQIIPLLPKALRKHATTLYWDGMEVAVDRLATALDGALNDDG